MGKELKLLMLCGLLSMALCLVQAAVGYLVATHFLKRRLNLA